MHKDWFFLVPSAGILTIAVFFAFLGRESMEIAALVFISGSVYYALKSLNSRESGRIPKISKVRLFGKSRTQ